MRLVPNTKNNESQQQLVSTVILMMMMIFGDIHLSICVPLSLLRGLNVY